jgi:gliding motility-associated-like protein
MGACTRPAIDVPTGFSPNGDGANDVLYVRGAAVETLSFKVYNRWGEKVFETDDINRGWDGSFKGKQQEMEAYAWVLDATFVDGTSVHRTGNVTLLR